MKTSGTCCAHQYRLTQVVCSLLAIVCVYKLKGSYLQTLANLSETDGSQSTLDCKQLHIYPGGRQPITNNCGPVTSLSHTLTCSQSLNVRK